MALHDPPLSAPVVDVQTGMVSRAWQEWFIVVFQQAVAHQAAITDAETDHATTTFAEVDSSLNALGSKVNSVIDILQASKLMDS